MTDIRDFLPQPPWNGPPVPRALGPSEYGAPSTAPAEIRELWQRILHETETQYPLDNPLLVSESRRAGVSPYKVRLMIAHDRWVEERRKIIERYYEEEGEVDPHA